MWGAHSSTPFCRIPISIWPIPGRLWPPAVMCWCRQLKTVGRNGFSSQVLNLSAFILAFLPDFSPPPCLVAWGTISIGLAQKWMVFGRYCKSRRISIVLRQSYSHGRSRQPRFGRLYLVFANDSLRRIPIIRLSPWINRARSIFRPVFRCVGKRRCECGASVSSYRVARGKGNGRNLLWKLSTARARLSLPTSFGRAISLGKRKSWRAVSP